MTHKVKPEILMVGSEQFPRCVILDANAPDRPAFWDGDGWTMELHKAMLFADEEAVQRELAAIYCRG